MKISAVLPSGVAALFFASARRRRDVEERLMARLHEAGYSEVILPILDYLKPYESLLTPARQRELYRFVDQQGDLLTLRAAFTPMLARLLAPLLPSLELPLRLYYRGDVIRYGAEQVGQMPEFYGLGAELLGFAGEQAEREVLRLFLELATSEDGGALRVVLGFAGALDRLLLSAGTGDPVRLAAAVARRERGEVRQACPRLLGVVENGVPDLAEDLGPEAAKGLLGLYALRDELAADFPGVSLTVDLAEFVRSSLDPRLAVGEEDFPYYDGLIFKAYAGPAATPVGGGGRYERLFRHLGAEVLAVGFSLNLERLLAAVD